MVRNAVRTCWTEPRAPGPPARVWRDWVLVGGLVSAVAVEGTLRSDLVWRPLSIALWAALALVLLWRRTRPLLAVIVTFGSITVVDVAAIIAGVDWTTLTTPIFVLLLPYSLFRWGAGREAAVGLPIMLTTAIVGSVRGPETVTDLLGGILILLLFAALGASVRFYDSWRLRETERVKLLEREQLARELHDTVAHHVSAIAVQAQAGRAVAESRPAAAVDALDAIEEEASRTLTEMRAMVGALRDGGKPNLAPQPGVADIERLARTTGDGPRIEVELSGDLDGLRPSIDSAIYRLAQESITNAVRHARHATRIDVRVAGDRDHVRLTVNDDGATAQPGVAAAGYGLAGMSERAKLLGGTIEAGPDPVRGWTVDAVLPRGGPVR